MPEFNVCEAGYYRLYANDGNRIVTYLEKNLMFDPMFEDRERQTSAKISVAYWMNQPGWSNQPSESKYGYSYETGHSLFCEPGNKLVMTSDNGRYRISGNGVKMTIYYLKQEFYFPGARFLCEAQSLGSALQPVEISLREDFKTGLFPQKSEGRREECNTFFNDCPAAKGSGRYLYVSSSVGEDHGDRQEGLLQLHQNSCPLHQSLDNRPPPLYICTFVNEPKKGSNGPGETTVGDHPSSAENTLAAGTLTFSGRTTIASNGSSTVDDACCCSSRTTLAVCVVAAACLLILFCTFRQKIMRRWKGAVRQRNDGSSIFSSSWSKKSSGSSSSASSDSSSSESDDSSSSESDDV